MESTILLSEIDEFRALGHKFLNKEISVAEFKTKSGGMGVYAQRGGQKFMIRLRVSSGVLSFEHLKLIENYAQKYNLNQIHLTTRQAIQLHDLSIDDVCDIMEDAILHDLFTRGGGGNFPRNVSLSPLSGVEKGEAFDVTDYALQVGDYLMSKMVSYHLPRKLKIAFSSSDKDSANSTINDLGFLAVVKDGKPYFKVYIAGGLGNNPAVSIDFGELIEVSDVLYHVEAITQLFVAEGDYSNKAKARIRYIPRRMGVDNFVQCYKEHLQKVKDESSFDDFDKIEAVITDDEHNNPVLKANNNLIPQKQNGLYSVILHPISGQFKTKDLKNLIAFLETCDNKSIRLSMEEDMYIRNLTADKATELLDIMAEMNKTTKIEQSISCIGVPTCQMGIEQSQTLLKNILDVLNNQNAPLDVLPAIHISGCLNSCSRHQVSEIGFAGCKKKIDGVSEDAFEVHINGIHSKDKTELGASIGIMLFNKIPLFICELAFLLDKEKISFIQLFTEKEDLFKSLISKYIIQS